MAVAAVARIASPRPAPQERRAHLEITAAATLVRALDQSLISFGDSAGSLRARRNERQKRNPSRSVLVSELPEPGTAARTCHNSFHKGHMRCRVATRSKASHNRC